MKHLKKLIILLPTILILSINLSINNYTFAGEAGKDIEVDYYIIPKIEDEEISEIQEATEEIGKAGGSVMETYREKAENLTVPQQWNSGIMTRDAIMNYLVFIIKFLSQFGLVVGAGFIMYAGYKYMISVFNSNRTSPDMVKNAIIGVIIVVFSYAIMKTLTSIAGLS